MTTIQVPAASGAGAAVPVSGAASGRTVIYAGGSAADVIDLEGSIDGDGFASVCTIKGAAAVLTIEDRSLFYRANRRGGSSSGVMNVSVGALSSSTMPPTTSTAEPNTIALRDGLGDIAFRDITARNVVANGGLFVSVDGGQGTFVSIAYSGQLAASYSGGLHNVAILLGETDLHLASSTIPTVWLHAGDEFNLTIAGWGGPMLTALPGKLGFFGAPAAAKRIVSGSRQTSPATILQTLAAAGAALGLWEDQTTD